MRVDELVDKARLSHAYLADYSDYLAMTRPGLLQGLLQGQQLLLPAHKASQPARYTGL
jgi:hypothetical protein